MTEYNRNKSDSPLIKPNYENQSESFMRMQSMGNLVNDTQNTNDSKSNKKNRIMENRRSKVVETVYTKL